MFALSTLLWGLNIHVLWKRIHMAFLHSELGPIKTRVSLANKQTAKYRYIMNIAFIIEVHLRPLICCFVRIEIVGSIS